MTETSVIDMSTAGARSETYGRLAQAFIYPEIGSEGLLGAVDYTDAFDPSASQNACSIREYHYAREIHSTALNEELLRFYHFFGLSRSAEAEMPDHVSVELQFMQFLAALENKAIERGEDATSVKKAQRDFLQRHLSILADGIKSSYKSESETCWALVEMTQEVVDVDFQRLAEEFGLGSDVAT